MKDRTGAAIVQHNEVFLFPSTHHVCLFVCVTGLLRRSQQWHKSSEQLVLLQLQHRQLLISLVFLGVHLVEWNLAVVHACQHVTQVS